VDLEIALERARPIADDGAVGRRPEVGIALDGDDDAERRDLHECHDERVIARANLQAVTEDRHRVRERASGQIAVERGIEVWSRLAVDGPSPGSAPEVPLSRAVQPA